MASLFAMPCWIIRNASAHFKTCVKTQNSVYPYFVSALFSPELHVGKKKLLIAMNHTVDGLLGICRPAVHDYFYPVLKAERQYLPSVNCSLPPRYCVR